MGEQPLTGSMCAGNSTLSWAAGRGPSASGPTSTWPRRVLTLTPGRSSTGWRLGNLEKVMIFERVAVCMLVVVTAMLYVEYKVKIKSDSVFAPYFFLFSMHLECTQGMEMIRRCTLIAAHRTHIPFSCMLSFSSSLSLS